MSCALVPFGYFQDLEAARDFLCPYCRRGSAATGRESATTVQSCGLDFCCVRQRMVEAELSVTELSMKKDNFVNGDDQQISTQDGQHREMRHWAICFVCCAVLTIFGWCFAFLGTVWKESGSRG